MPVLRAMIGGAWVEVPMIGSDEVSVGPDTPTDSNVELWYDTDDPGGPQITNPVKLLSATSYAPVLGDEGYMMLLSNAAAITVTMPSNTTQLFAINTEIHWVWYGVGQPTFVAGASATVLATPSLLMRARYSVVTTKKTDINEWLLFGDLA